MNRSYLITLYILPVTESYATFYDGTHESQMVLPWFRVGSTTTIDLHAKSYRKDVVKWLIWRRVAWVWKSVCFIPNRKFCLIWSGLLSHGHAMRLVSLASLYKALQAMVLMILVLFLCFSPNPMIIHWYEHLTFCIFFRVIGLLDVFLCLLLLGMPS